MMVTKCCRFFVFNFKKFAVDYSTNVVLCVKFEDGEGDFLALAGLCALWSLLCSSVFNAEVGDWWPHHALLNVSNIVI